jgi:REP element-mobilizing transposase RayT
MLKRFFITWVTHNSRYSERMKLYKVEKKEWFFLDFNDRLLIYNLISKKIEEKWKKDFTLNVLSDHVHLVILYDENKLSKFIWEIKWWVSFEFSRLKNFSKIWDWKWNKIWAKWFSKTFLNTDEHYEKAIDYTINNSEKHNIENIIPLNQ